MAGPLPLFPLNTVLFPGVVMPLYIFEERYRLLVRRLVGLPAGSPRRFGVVSIREGSEVGTSSVRSLHALGCTAELGQVEAYEDGRFDTVSLGTSRFRLHGVDDTLPYLQGDVELLPEVPGSGAGEAAAQVSRLFRAYRVALASARGEVPDEDAVELPEEPSVLSYFVAAATVLEIDDKQRLLAADDDATRLRAEAELLRRETAVLRVLPSMPAVDLARAGTSVN